MVGATGHVDSAPPAEVFPAGWGGLAAADGAMPAFAAGGCGGVYCHGGGESLADDLAPGLVRTPSWSGGGGEVFCGSCHGAPPVDGTHAPGLGLGDCASCHPSSVDAFGNPLGTHLDGAIDAL
jgi:predicted CxxxxCH...CXXCH cytochrome family protein